MCTPFYAGRCAPYFCSLFICCGDIVFPTASNFLRERHKAHTHPSYVPHMTRTLPGQNQKARGSLYSTRILSHLFPFPEHVWCQSLLHLALSLTLIPPTTSNFSDDISFQLSLPLNPLTPFRSSLYILVLYLLFRLFAAFPRKVIGLRVTNHADY